MVIRSGDDRWTVECRDCPGERAEGGEVVDLTFRREEREDERVEVGWIPLDGELTEAQAAQLFALAGRRQWRDSRTGRVYDVTLTDEGSAEDLDHPIGITFRRGAEPVVGLGCYPLTRSLGEATDVELQAMLDAALHGLGGFVSPGPGRFGD